MRPGFSPEAAVGHGARRERYLHLAFRAALLFKGLFALGEIGTGVGAYVLTTSRIVQLARALTRHELLEDPRDPIANLVLHAAQHLSVASEHFMGLYLVSHGVVKLVLILALLREIIGVYPISMAAFALFIAYQVYRYTLTGSPALIALTVVDLAVIALTWHEYRYLRARRANSIES